MTPWILLGVVFMVAGAMSGWWLNRHPAPLSADPIGIDLDDARDNGGFDEGDDLDDVCRSVGVLCDDSRVWARWCDQPTIDRLFAGMVDTPAMRAIDHRIRPATPDKEN